MNAPPKVPAPPAVAAVLDETVAFLRRFVVFADEHQADAAALWIAHTHAIDAFEQTPYLFVKSAEKRSGKSRLLEVVECLVRRPWMIANASESSLFRKIEQDCPTLLFDEVDAIFKGSRSDDRTEGLRGLLNAGCRRRGKIARSMPVGQKVELVEFSVFCPKLLAGIGDCLPDTLADRSIPIVLRRKAGHERVARWRFLRGSAEAAPVADRLAAWADDAVEALTGAEPDLPDELDDRAQDAWEPLVSIADVAGGDWPGRARRAAVALSAGRDGAEDSLGVRLLTDCRDVIGDRDHIFTADLIEGLAMIEESPWGDWWGGGDRGGPRRLAEILRRYEIKSTQVRIGGTSKKGYVAADFADAWLRYLPVPPDTRVYPKQGNTAGQSTYSPPTRPAGVSDEKQHLTCDVSDVSDRSTEPGGGAAEDAVPDAAIGETKCSDCGKTLFGRLDLPAVCSVCDEWLNPEAI